MDLDLIENQTTEICLEAVKNNGLALRYVKLQNLNICLTAIYQNIFAIKYVKWYLIDEVLKQLPDTKFFDCMYGFILVDLLMMNGFFLLILVQIYLIKTIC